MTGTVSFPWIDGGKKLEVRKIPINGERELKQILMQHSRIVTLQRNSFNYAFHGIVLATKIVFDKKGVNSAKDSWDASLKSNSLDYPELIWSHEEWNDRFHAYYEDHTLRQLGAKDFEGAKNELEKRMIATAEELQAIGEDNLALDIDYGLIEVYWRLRAAGAKAITAEGETTPLKWGRDDRENTLDLLGDYVNSEVAAAFRKAEGDAKRGRFDIKDFKEADEDEMRGKSEPTSTPSTKLSGDSPPSLEPTTAEIEMSATSETRSG